MKKKKEKKESKKKGEHSMNTKGDVAQFFYYIVAT